MDCYKFATFIYMRKRSKRIKRIKRKSTKKHRKTRQRGGDLSVAYRLSKVLLEHLEPIKITYGKTFLQPNQDLTGKELLYNKKPTIEFNPHKEKTYLITMTDPDAPNGVGQAKQTWTHYVIRMNNNNVVEEIYPYHPPTPPPNSGVHHYIFNAYEYKNEKISNPKLLSANLMDGNVYYKQILEPIIKNKDVMARFQFTVNA